MEALDRELNAQWQRQRVSDRVCAAEDKIGEAESVLAECIGRLLVEGDGAAREMELALDAFRLLGEASAKLDTLLAA
jgi:hypothetical protein